MKRRDFLKYMMAATSGGLMLSHNTVSAVTAPAPKTLVVIFQRGGCDGLNVVVPHGEDMYYNLRPTIAIPRPGATGGALDMDGFFGLHPAMSSLHGLYQSGLVAAFPAVHYRNASRSHFDSQKYIESAQISRDATGWLNRHLSTTSNSTGMRGVSFGSSLSQALRGPISVSSFNDLRNFDLDLEAQKEQRLVSRLSAIYNQNSTNNRQYDDLLRQSGRTLFSDLETVSNIDVENYQPTSTVNYPNNSYGRQLAQTAQLIKEGTGVELATITHKGWDTHKNQGGAEGGMANNLRSFSDGITAFYQDMGSRMSDIMILTMTEFGRTAKENGSSGTDHGHASSWFALGGGVTGGLYGQWPGLEEANLERGRYLAQATDFRDIFAEITTGHLGNTNSSIIPSYNSSPIGFL